MRAPEQIELAGLLATHGATLIRCQARLSNQSLNSYWTGSRFRLERWSEAIHNYQQLRENRLVPPEADDEEWLQMRVQLEEIIVSEVLTRVWLGITRGIDCQRKTVELEPPARSVMLGHMEARQRALGLLVDPRIVDSGEAEWLHRLQQRSERWNDLLIGRLVAQNLGDLSQAASYPDRALEFAEDLRRDHQLVGDEMAWSLLITSMQTVFAPCLDIPSPNTELNKMIAVSILACFPPDMFDSIGLAKSLWQVRLDNITSDAQGLLHEFMELESSLPPSSARESRAGQGNNYLDNGNRGF
ncbi:MAG: hypothetical protein CMJ81_24715 [Planctomycetaceae bacterium]|nr:hypothetical protein [Planctomycetaceae bacterium]